MPRGNPAPRLNVGNRGNTSGKRGHRQPRLLTLDLGTDMHQTLRILAQAASSTPEQLAAGWLAERISQEWQEYNEHIQAATWEGEIL